MSDLLHLLEVYASLFVQACVPCDRLLHYLLNPNGRRAIRYVHQFQGFGLGVREVQRAFYAVQERALLSCCSLLPEPMEAG